jgi:hypothetical protein
MSSLIWLSWVYMCKIFKISSSNQIQPPYFTLSYHSIIINCPLSIPKVQVSHRNTDYSSSLHTCSLESQQSPCVWFRRAMQVSLEICFGRRDRRQGLGQVIFGDPPTWFALYTLAPGSWQSPVAQCRRIQVACPSSYPHDSPSCFTKWNRSN